MLGFLRANFRWVAGGFLLTYCSTFGQTYFISASIGEWQSRFDLTHGEIGRLYMLATLASAATLPWLGRLADRWSAVQLVILAIPMLAAAATLAGMAWSPLVLVIAIYGLRLFGQGFLTHIALTMTGRWFVAARGRAVSLVVLGHQGGEATLLLAFVGVSGLAGYQAGWFAAAGALLAIGLPLAAWAYARPRQPQATDTETLALHSAARQWTRGEVLRDPVFWVLLTGVLAPAFIGTTIFYHQDYLAALHGWAPGVFARSLMFMAATTITTALIFGGLIDRYGAVRLVPMFLVPLSLACFALTLVTTPTGLVGVVVLVGVSYGISSTLFGALWPEIYGTEHLGAVRSVIMSAMVFSTAAGPGITGTLIDAGYPLPMQMGVMGVYCVLACGSMAIAATALKRRHA